MAALTPAVRRPVVLDAGALRDAEKNPNGRTWALCRAEVAQNRTPLLPILLLAQMWRGGARQAGLARVVRLCEIVNIDEPMSRRIGALLATTGTSDIVDAMVVLVALDTGAAVLTSDPGDITKLAALGANLRLITL